MKLNHLRWSSFIQYAFLIQLVQALTVIGVGSSLNNSNQPQSYTSLFQQLKQVFITTYNVAPLAGLQIATSQFARLHNLFRFGLVMLVLARLGFKSKTVFFYNFRRDFTTVFVFKIFEPFIAPLPQYETLFGFVASITNPNIFEYSYQSILDLIMSLKLWYQIIQKRDSKNKCFNLETVFSIKNQIQKYF